MLSIHRRFLELSMHESAHRSKKRNLNNLNCNCTMHHDNLYNQRDPTSFIHSEGLRGKVVH